MYIDRLSFATSVSPVSPTSNSMFLIQAGVSLLQTEREPGRALHV